MNAVNDTIDVSRDLKNNSLSGTNLENSNSLALPTVQTTLMRQASNGCLVTMRFREKQEQDIDCSVASMQLAVFQRLHDKEGKPS